MSVRKCSFVPLLQFHSGSVCNRYPFGLSHYVPTGEFQDLLVASKSSWPGSIRIKTRGPSLHYSL